MSDLHARHPLEPPSVPPPETPDYPEQDAGEGYPAPEIPEEQKHTSAWLWIGVVLAALVLAIFWVRDVFLIIRNVEVQGVRQRPWQEVAIAAGFDKPVNYFGLNEDRIREGINSNRYYTYLGMDKNFPNSVTLRVRERIPVAYLHYIGVGYLLGDDGLVLEQTRELEQTQGYASITGMQIRDIRVGAVPTGTRPQQLTSALSVLRELAMQGYLENIQDVNVTEPTSILLITRDGYAVHIGDDEQLRAKIGTVRAVIEDLKRRGFTGGVIEATMPGEATYRPETQ